MMESTLIIHNRKLMQILRNQLALINDGQFTISALRRSDIAILLQVMNEVLELTEENEQEEQS